MPRPEPLDLLKPVERMGWRLGDRVARRYKRAASVWSTAIIGGAARALLGRRLEVQGLEHLAGIGPQERVLLVANHRSFFDFFLIGAVAMQRTALPRRTFFPVRASFFYSNPLGVLLNLVVSGMCMFPPLLRDRSRMRFNHFALDRVVEALGEPGTLVGLHPEGTRGQGPDPYTLLRPRAGVGRVILDAAPGLRVVPVFVLGLGNRLLQEAWDNLRRPGKTPVEVIFGPELDFSDLVAQGSHPATHRAASGRCLEAIARLGEVDRALRQARGLPAPGGRPEAAAPGASGPRATDHPAG